MTAAAWVAGGGAARPVLGPVTTLEGALAAVLLLTVATLLAFVRALLTGRLRSHAEYEALRADRDFYRLVAFRAVRIGEAATELTPPPIPRDG